MLRRLKARFHDVGLTLLVLAAGPTLLLCGRILLPESSETETLVGGILAVTSQSFSSVNRGGLQNVEELIGLGAVAGGLLISLLATLLTVLSAAAVTAQRLGALRAEALLSRASPDFMRRALIVTLSAQIALVGSIVPQHHAHASEEQSITAQSSSSYAAHPTAVAAQTVLFTTAEQSTGTENIMTPLFTPTVPAAPAERHRGAEQRQSHDDHDQITVRPGDTLWGLVAADLGPGATDWEIARDWPQWYERNRSVIGDDPGELTPGIVLEKPQPVH